MNKFNKVVKSVFQPAGKADLKKRAENYTLERQKENAELAKRLDAGEKFKFDFDWAGDEETPQELATYLKNKGLKILSFKQGPNGYPDITALGDKAAILRFLEDYDPDWNNFEDIYEFLKEQGVR